MTAIPTPRGAAAIRYHPRGFDTGQERLMGMHAANAEFLSAFVRSAAADETLHCYARSAEDFADFRGRAERLGLPPGTAMAHIPFTEPRRLGEPGCLYLAAPVLGPSAWIRRALGNRNHSLCGITNTVSTPRVMDALADFLIAPVQPWDALICTSAAIKTVVTQVLDETAEYLAHRIGVRPTMPIQLPVIPLGVDVANMRTMVTAERRQAFRADHGIEVGDVVVLFLGRLSAHSKAHPTPMFRALERAAALSARRLVLVLAGWFYSEDTRAGFLAAAAAYMPSVRMIVLDGRSREARAGAWSGADIFTSLTDNIQESFGLTPVEAMAAGLPAVVSDWNGYRDTVVEGESGFFVPTIMPPAGAGADLALAVQLDIDDHEMHIARTSQCVAVDIDAAAQAYARLAAEPDLRRRMGDAGQWRAIERFAWPSVMARYRQLWMELAERRVGEAELVPAGQTQAWPTRADPFARFAPFASAAIGSGMRIAAADSDPIQAFRHAVGLPLAVFDPTLLPAAEAIVRQVAASKLPLLIEGAVMSIGVQGRALDFRAMAWLAKLGIVRITR